MLVSCIVAIYPLCNSKTVDDQSIERRMILMLSYSSYCPNSPSSSPSRCTAPQKSEKSRILTSSVRKQIVKTGMAMRSHSILGIHGLYRKLASWLTSRADNNTCIYSRDLAGERIACTETSPVCQQETSNNLSSFLHQLVANHQNTKSFSAFNPLSQSSGGRKANRSMGIVWWKSTTHKGAEEACLHAVLRIATKILQSTHTPCASISLHQRWHSNETCGGSSLDKVGPFWFEHNQQCACTIQAASWPIAPKKGNNLRE